MPIISQFYGILIRMFFKDNKQHNLPHIHVSYAENIAVFDLEGNILEGSIPKRQQKLVEAWILIHQEELKALWEAVLDGDQYFKIDPLK